MAMPSLIRQPTFEETLVRVIAKSWKFFSSVIRQFIIFFPNLRASYERERRKVGKLKAGKQNVAMSRVERIGWPLFNIESYHLRSPEVDSETLDWETELSDKESELLEAVLKSIREGL